MADDSDEFYKNFHVYENNILAGKEKISIKGQRTRVFCLSFPRLSINFEIIQCHKKPRVASDAQTHIKKLQKPKKVLLLPK